MACGGRGVRLCPLLGWATRGTQRKEWWLRHACGGRGVRVRPLLGWGTRGTQRNGWVPRLACGGIVCVCACYQSAKLALSVLVGAPSALLCNSRGPGFC